MHVYFRLACWLMSPWVHVVIALLPLDHTWLALFDCCGRAASGCYCVLRLWLGSDTMTALLQMWALLGAVLCNQLVTQSLLAGHFIRDTCLSCRSLRTQWEGPTSCAGVQFRHHELAFMLVVEAAACTACSCHCLPFQCCWTLLLMCNVRSAIQTLFNGYDQLLLHMMGPFDVSVI